MESQTIKENQIIMLEHIITVTKDIKDIKDQFKELNGSVRDTIIKLARAETIAQQAQKRADEAHLQSIENPRENRRYIDKLFITALGSMLTAIAAIIAAVIGIIAK